MADEMRPDMDSAHQHVLVVEDEGSVRSLLVRWLSQDGYTVAAAGDGQEGIARLEDDREIAVVVCDLVMPGMNGFQFVEASARRWPGLRYIFITGAAEERVLEDATRLPGPLVMKPFIPYRISDAIAAVLANPAAHDVETEPPPPPLPAA